MEPIYTVEEVAEQMKVTPYTVREWIKAKKLTAAKIGKLWRVRESDLEAFIERQTVRGEENSRE